MNRQRVIGDLHRTVRNFHDPEETIWQSPRTEIMQLGRQTDVPEVESYLHEGAVRTRRFCGTCTVNRIRCLASSVFPLIYADVRDNGVFLPLFVRRRAARVPHSRDAAKIGDAVWIRIHGIERGSLVRRAGKELIEKPVTRDYIATRNRDWLNGEIRYWFDLGRQRN